MNTTCIQITTTFDKREDAVAFAEKILDAKLAACAQISEIESFYTFEGNRYSDEKEFILTMKTRDNLYEKCETFIKQNHPYRVPQIVAITLKYASGEYLEWIDENVQNQE